MVSVHEYSSLKECFFLVMGNNINVQKNIPVELKKDPKVHFLTFAFLVATNAHFLFPWLNVLLVQHIINTASIL